MKFTKYHALGNDYLVYSGADEFCLSKDEVVRICDRRYGVGADGILFLERLDNEKVVVRILNSDGSEAEKSGNGLRILSKYLWDIGFVSKKPFQLHTQGGVVSSKVLDQGRCVEVSMGKANFSSSNIGMSTYKDQVINYPVEVLDQVLNINAVSMGNPHCVVFVDEISQKITKRLGPILEKIHFF